MARECGECYVCCDITEVVGADFIKPAKTQCPFLKDCPTHKCAIYETRPKCCADFQCSWLRGFGDEDDRPDKNGLMVSIGNFNGGTWIFAMEIKVNAAQTSGKNILLNIGEQIFLPIIVVKYGFDPNTNKGDYVIVHKALLHRASQLAGELLGYLDDEELFGMYKLIIH